MILQVPAESEEQNHSKSGFGPTYSPLDRFPHYISMVNSYKDTGHK